MERGVREKIDYSLLGTFGTPWIQYHFSFGKWTTFKQPVPSVMMFTTCIGTGWVGAQQLSFCIYGNPFSLPIQLDYFLRPLFYLPIVARPFIIGWIGHVMMDWSVNVESSDKIKEQGAKGVSENMRYILSLLCMT